MAASLFVLFALGVVFTAGAILEYIVPIEIQEKLLRFFNID